MPGTVRAFSLGFGGARPGASLMLGPDTEGARLGRLEMVVGTVGPAALLSLSVLNALAPAMLPGGMAERLGLMGRGRNPPLSGIGPDIRR